MHQIYFFQFSSLSLFHHNQLHVFNQTHQVAFGNGQGYACSATQQKHQFMYQLKNIHTKANVAKTGDTTSVLYKISHR